MDLYETLTHDVYHPAIEDIAIHTGIHWWLLLLEAYVDTGDQHCQLHQEGGNCTVASGDEVSC